MTCKSPEFMVTLVVSALQQTGMRAIIQGGWARLSMETLKAATADIKLIAYAEANALFVETSPHEWLFPQCSAIIHHGGAGTLACSIRSGVPTITTPIFLDQYDHTFLVNELGVGFGFTKQFQKMKAQELASAILKVVGDAGIAEKAASVAKSVRAENGAVEVVKHTEVFWTEWVESGRFKQFIDDRRSKRKPVTCLQ